MASNVIRVSILADAKRFQSGFREAEGAAQSFQSKMSAVAAGVATVLAAKAVTAVKDFVSDSVRAYSDLEQATGGVETVFGRFADTIETESKRAAESVGLSESAYKKMAAVLGAQLQGLGFDLDVSAEKTKFLIERGADLAATLGGTTAEAVAAISSLLRNERDPIEHWGISIKDADVKARAMAAGLDMSTTEAQKQSGAIAALDLLLDQSARSAGKFASEQETVANKTQRANAQLENQKAVVGERWAQTWTDATVGIQGGILKVIAEIGAEIDMLTGKIDESQAAVAEYEAQTGNYVDTAEDAIEVSRKYALRLGDVVNAASLSVEELRRLRDVDRDVLMGMGHTAEEVEYLSDVLEEKLVAATNAARDAARHQGRQNRETADDVEDLAGAQEDLAEETQTATDKIKAQQSALRETYDPAFAYMTATNDLAEAQERYNEAVAKFGENSPEAIAAASDIADANFRIQEAVTQIGTKGVPAAMNALKSLGVPQAVIDKFSADRRRIEEIFRNMVLKVSVSAPTLYPTRPSSGGVGWESETRTYHARGGIAMGDRHLGGGDHAGEAGAEALLPLDSSHGISVLAAALSKALSQTGGFGPAAPVAPVIIDVRGLARTQPLDGWAIIEALQRVAQSSGPLPIQVRS